MTDLERYSADVVTIGQSSFCPQHYRDRESGQPRWADLAFAVETLRHLNLDPLRNIDATYVIGGKVSFLAELQRVLVRRAGFDLEVVETDDKAAAVRIRRLPVGPGLNPDDYPWREVTVTMAEANKAGWPKRNPSYETMPDRMLVARACTRAISLYAPEASRLIGLSEGGDADAGIDNRTAQSTQQGGRGEQLHTVRRDEPTVSPERIAHLKGQIQGMSLADQDALRSICKSLRMPNIDSAAFTLRDAALLHRLIAELTPEGPYGAVILDDDPDDPTRPFDDDD